MTVGEAFTSEISTRPQGVDGAQASDGPWQMRKIETGTEPDLEHLSSERPTHRGADSARLLGVARKIHDEGKHVVPIQTHGPVSHDVESLMTVGYAAPVGTPTVEGTGIRRESRPRRDPAVTALLSTTPSR